jgi:hypothetical protein
MASETEQLVVSLEARIRDFEKSFVKAGGIANTGWTDIENRSKRGAKNVEDTFGQMSKRVNSSLASM